jgi:hypothetical protein
MPNYQNSKIYVIRSHKTDLIYIGATTLSLCARLGEHRRMFNYLWRGNGINSKNRGCCSREILQFDDAYIELLENYPCNSKEELLKREGEFIRKHKNKCVNVCIPGRNMEQWREDNKDKLKAYTENYEKNRRVRQRKNKIETKVDGVNASTTYATRSTVPSGT